MARKRLTPIVPPAPRAAPSVGNPPDAGAFGAAASVVAAPRRSDPPIARVAGETAAEAALAEVTAEIARARAEGRLIVALPLEQIAEDHLVRDRVVVDDGELEVLMRSIADRGQQTAIEVIDFGAEPAGRRYGLISGWRRLMALRRLQAQTGEGRFATIRALVRQPETAADAYRAMVDENEIRVGLSYWERARIAVQAAETGIHATVQLALRDLFAAASRAKRSKIGSFVTIYQTLGEALVFPTALPERLGLQLARALETRPELAELLIARLQATPAKTAAEEQARLKELLETAGVDKPPASEPAAAPLVAGSGAKSRAMPQAAAGIRLRRTGQNRLVLEGEGVDPLFEATLAAWLERI